MDMLAYDDRIRGWRVHVRYTNSDATVDVPPAGIYMEFLSLY